MDRHIMNCSPSSHHLQQHLCSSIYERIKNKYSIVARLARFSGVYAELGRQLDDGNRNIPSKFGRTATNEAAMQPAVCRLFERATVRRSKGDSASRFCRGIVIRTLEHAS